MSVTDMAAYLNDRRDRQTTEKYYTKLQYESVTYKFVE